MTYEEYISNDPTLKFFREAKIDYEHFDHQVRIKLLIAQMSILKYIATKYFKK